jgi:hypothetical protein
MELLKAMGTLSFREGFAVSLQRSRVTQYTDQTVQNPLVITTLAATTLSVTLKK